MYSMGVHTGATWYIRLYVAAMSGSATRGGGAACSQITLSSLVGHDEHANIETLKDR